MPHLLTNAMTIDVEDYFQVSAFADRIASRDWGNFPSRVEQNTRRLLTLLEKAEVRATFFVLGWVAEQHPQLIRDIARAGHEIGCHSYWHRLVYDLTPDEFREDTRQAQQLLEDIIGDRVTLYRAPSFSITERSLWALDILADLGFDCDSSIYPIHHDRYGIPGSNPFPHVIHTKSGELHEFPGSICRLGGMSIPVSGGGYFRLYPARVTAWLLNRVNRRGQPFMFYLHPWELDPDQPRLAGSLRSRFRHYQNLASTERKLNWLLPRFRFGTMSEALREIPISKSQCPMNVQVSNSNGQEAVIAVP
ncbi:MAG: XrtA system polysaccharide deacetylase [Planctomycetaceae bacterium]